MCPELADYIILGEMRKSWAVHTSAPSPLQPPTPGHTNITEARWLTREKIGRYTDAFDQIYPETTGEILKQLNLYWIDNIKFFIAR